MPAAESKSRPVQRFLSGFAKSTEDHMQCALHRMAVLCSAGHGLRRFARAPPSP